VAPISSVDCRGVGTTQSGMIGRQVDGMMRRLSPNRLRYREETSKLSADGKSVEVCGSIDCRWRLRPADKSEHEQFEAPLDEVEIGGRIGEELSRRASRHSSIPRRTPITAERMPDGRYVTSKISWMCFRWQKWCSNHIRRQRQRRRGSTGSLPATSPHVERQRPTECSGVLQCEECQRSRFFVDRVEHLEEAVTGRRLRCGRHRILPAPWREFLEGKVTSSLAGSRLVQAPARCSVIRLAKSRQDDSNSAPANDRMRVRPAFCRHAMRAHVIAKPARCTPAQRLRCGRAAKRRVTPAARIRSGCHEIDADGVADRRSRSGRRQISAGRRAPCQKAGGPPTARPELFRCRDKACQGLRAARWLSR